MKVSFRWLQDYVEVDVSPEEFAERMTMAGLEAEKIEHIGDNWDNVFVGLVRGVSQHPDADRLVLADIEAGEHRLTVVTGAPNIAKGQKVALALAGANLIDAYADELKYKTLKPGKIRGVMSEGMACSEKELGLSEEHEGIMVLEPDAPVGASLKDYLGDTVIEFEITPNLVHAFSMVGIAREVSAVLESDLRLPAEFNLSDHALDDELVTIDAPDLCRRYIGVVIEGITVEPSPPWLTERLSKAGVRPINNLVDITNYVMLETGQPLHAFDRSLIETGKIFVRRGQSGEQIVTLDHQLREVDESTLLITDGHNAVALAGVMGGVDSEVAESTSSILLEAAHFDMVNVRHTSRRLKLRTDASTRFERGIDPELARSATQRALKLILDLCPEARVIAWNDTYPAPVEQRTVSMPFSRIERVLGIPIASDTVTDILTRLELQPQVDEANDTLTVQVPTWRSDITIPEDVIEEVARIVGYAELPATLPTGTMPVLERDPLFLLERLIRRTLVSAGLYEGRSYATLSHAEVEQWSTSTSVSLTSEVANANLVRLRNPVNSERPYLRPSIVPSLLDDVAANLKHQTQVKLFEVAHVYCGTGSGELPDEPSHLAIVVAGSRHELSRFDAGSGNQDELDFWDAKGVLDALFVRLRLPVSYKPDEHPALHPGRTAQLVCDGQLLGILGEVHPQVATGYGIEQRLTIAEIDVSALLELRPTLGGIQITADQYLPAEQDFSIVVDEGAAAGRVEEALRQGAGPLVTNVVLFDVYQGETLEPGKKSLTFRVTFTAPDRALTDKELAKNRTRIERSLSKELGASLRS
jgi:phenylalanyl-tRNA synthetase beta chain